MAEQIKLECSIDYDDEWSNFEVGSDFSNCHFKYDRIFTITWVITDPENEINNKYFYYKLSSTASYVQIAEEDLEHKDGSNIWKYELNLSEFNTATLTKHRTKDGWLNIYAYVEVETLTSIISKEASYANGYYLELPPEHPVKSLDIKAITTKPGELKCSWARATAEYPDEVHGYCIELLKCPANLDSTIEENYSLVYDLAWNEDRLAKTEDRLSGIGEYELIKKPVNEEFIFPETVEGEEEIISFGALGNASEAYIKNPEVTHFYFSPEKLGLNKGDYYKFVIYPYQVYSCYLEGEEEENKLTHYTVEHGAYITNEGTVSAVKQVPKAVMHIKTAEGWVEGIVYVMTGKGWVEADSVYVNTKDGWKETT